MIQPVSGYYYIEALKDDSEDDSGIYIPQEKKSGALSEGTIVATPFDREHTKFKEGDKVVYLTEKGLKYGNGFVVKSEDIVGKIA